MDKKNFSATNPLLIALHYRTASDT